VKGMAILDNDGNRILAKYYDDNIFPTIKEQKAFEKNLFNRTHRANAEIIMLDGITCLYRSNVDLFFYVMGSSHENEVNTLSRAVVVNLFWFTAPFDFKIKYTTPIHFFHELSPNGISFYLEAFFLKSLLSNK